MHAAQAAVNRRESFYPQPTTRIKVSKLPDNVTENIIRYFFENRRVSGGGVVDTVDYDKTAHTAVVIFEEAEDVQRVIDKGPHLFDEKTIEVERQYIEEESNDRGYDKCTIEVTGMKQSATPFYIQLYFESRKGANSDVLSTDYIEEEEMYLVKFDSEEVVDAVIQKSHVLDGSKLNVRKHIPPQAEATYPKQVFVSGFSIKTSEELFSNYLEARSRVDIDKIIYGDIESTAIVIFKEQPDIDKLKVDCKKRKLDGEYLIIDYVPVSKCVIVSGIKEGISEDIVHYYFDNKRKSGVDGVEVVDLDAINRTCIVYFVDCEAPVEACKRKHSIEGCTVKVDIYHECLGGTACGDGPKCKPLDPIDNTFEPPKHWDIMGDEENYRVVVLKSGSHEYQDVMEKFNGSVGSHRQIQEIHRVQNKTYYQQYLAKKKLIDSTNPPNHQNEKILWHGFAKDVMESINKYGFNRSYCEKINSTAYGAGVYFTTSASLSVWDTYSVPDSNGNKRIYMCKVLTGEYTLGTGRMIIPPQKPSSGGAHNLYDCVVDNLPSPNMYIIFHDTQAYPEYMILFK